MRCFKADLHIHSVLSPCGDLDMSPSRIVEMAAELNLNIIAVTDHNATHHGPLVRRLGYERGIDVLFGAEITSKEEAHLLCLFDEEEQREEFQSFIDKNLPRIPNKPKTFGYQVVVNENEEIVSEVEYLLISGLNVGVNQISEEVHRLGGLFIPAHVDRPRYSLTSQLGFIPADLQFDALELSKNTSTADFIAKNGYLKNRRFIRNSDAHLPQDIGRQTTQFYIEKPTIAEIKMALWGLNGRYIQE